MKPSAACRDLVASFEERALEAYLCPAGVPTIGYGHTAGVKLGQTITPAAAESLLDADLGEFSQAVNRALTRPVTQPQFDALVSFAFNCKGWSGSTLLRLVNAGDIAGAALEFPKWIYATIKRKKIVLNGLVRRRAAEQELFRKA